MEGDSKPHVSFPSEEAREEETAENRKWRGRGSKCLRPQGSHTQPFLPSSPQGPLVRTCPPFREQKRRKHSSTAPHSTRSCTRGWKLPLWGRAPPSWRPPAALGRVARTGGCLSALNLVSENSSLLTPRGTHPHTRPCPGAPAHLACSSGSFRCLCMWNMRSPPLTYSMTRNNLVGQRGRCGPRLQQRLDLPGVTRW